MLILTFIMNLFDFYIVDKYYYCFSKERKRNTFFSITTLVASAFVLSIVNAIGYPIANLMQRKHKKMASGHFFICPKRKRRQHLSRYSPI